MHAAVRPPGGAFGDAEAVAAFSPAGGGGETPVAVTGAGEVVIAWTEGEPNPLGDRSHIAVASASSRAAPSGRRGCSRRPT